jgi:hypothetical protein
MYNDTSKTTLLDTQVVNVIFKGTNGTPGINATGVSISYTNDSHTAFVSTAGVATWTGSGGLLTIYEAFTPLNLLSNTQTAAYPSTGNTGYNLDIVAVSGDSLTEPTINGSGTTTATLGVWAGTLTTTTVYRVNAYVRTSTNATVLISKDISITPSKQGDASTIFYIVTSSPVITKEAPDVATSGVHSSLTATGKRSVGGTVTDFGAITITANGDTETGTATATTLTVLPATTAAKTSYTVRMYNDTSKTTLLDTQVVNVIFKGSTGAPSTVQGPRSVQIYFYFTSSQSGAPTAPLTSEVSYNFSTRTPSSTNANWTPTFTAPAPGTTTANNKMWAVTAQFSENVFGGTVSATVSGVFNWQNLDGLVTFSNLSGALGSGGTGTTFIDGGAITTNSITVDSLKSGDKSFSTGSIFRLGGFSSLVNLFDASVLGLITFQVQNTTTIVLNGIYLIVSGPPTNATSFGSPNNIVGTVFTATSAGTLSGGLVSQIVDRAGVIGNTHSPNYPGVGGVGLNLYSYGGGFYNWAGGAKKTQLVGGWGTHAALAQNVTSSKIITLADASYAAYAATGQGKIIAGDGFTPFTGIHDGLIAKSIAPSIGDILVDHQVLLKIDVSNIIAEYVMSSTPNQKGVIGVCNELYSEPPTDWQLNTELKTLNNEDIPPKTDYYPIPSTHQVVHINALGEGLINVCGEGGNIELGDLIVTSSIPGKGMKQADDIIRSYTVAKARESVTFSNSTEIKQIACIYLAG